MAQPTIDAVVIGRNEGARLRACLASLQGCVDALIYVDSGSTDGSPDLARAMGATVVDLDLSQPFTAARARNAGLAECTADLVQFVDGDCTVVPGWIQTAAQFLTDTPRAAVVCGRRREVAPDVSVFNRLCDIEWNTPVGKTKACGGDALMRCAPLQAVDGFREDLIAGEEPELCIRLRAAGWEIWRLDAEMTRHDAALVRFRQWWMRSKRAGHAFAQGAWLHGRGPDRHWVKETRRALIWGAGLPALIVLVALVALVALIAPFGPLTCIFPWVLLALLVYPLQFLRLARKGDPAWAFFTVLGKVPEALGVLQFYRAALRGKRNRLIEYK